MKLERALPLYLLLIGSIATVSAAELPVQKPGLWRSTMSGKRMPGGSRSYLMCMDAALIAAGKASSNAMMKKSCSAKSSIRNVGDTWIADTDCTMSGMHIVSHSVTTVHGSDQFHTEVSSTTDSPQGGKKTDVMSVDNKWLGACPAGQKVGVPMPEH